MSLNAISTSRIDSPIFSDYIVGIEKIDGFKYSTSTTESPGYILLKQDLMVTLIAIKLTSYQGIHTNLWSRLYWYFLSCCQHDIYSTSLFHCCHSHSTWDKKCISTRWPWSRSTHRATSLICCLGVVIEYGMLLAKVSIWPQAITSCMVWTFLDCYPIVWNDIKWCWSFFVLLSFSPRMYIS